jgi:hypothetical protein
MTPMEHGKQKGVAEIDLAQDWNEHLNLVGID